MKMVKSFLLASAAGLAATVGAQAADLPVKAKPVEYVKVCSLYGAGFFYLPGTQTCLKIGGYASYEAVFGGASASHIQRYNGSYALNTRNEDWFVQRARLNLSFDTRTQTEYGTLRTYTLLDILQNTSNPDYNAAVTNNNYAPIPAYVFIQLAGFTVGKAISLTRPDWVGSLPWSNAALVGGGDMGAGNVGVLQASYTFELGNGAKLSMGVEDATYGRYPLFDTVSAGTNPLTAIAWGNNSFAGQQWPDFVANFQLNQAWGGLMVGGLVRNMNATYYQSVIGGASTGVVETNGGPNNKLGWGVFGGLQVKNIPTGQGDTFSVLGGVAEGIGNLTHSVAPGTTLLGATGSTTVPGAYQSMAFGPILDGVYASPAAGGGQLELTRFYAASAGFEHWWIPAKFRSSLYGAYEAIRYNNNAKALLCVNAARSPINLTASNCNFDIDIWQAGTRSVYTVVPGFDLIGEFAWTRLDTKLTGFVAPTAGNLKPSGPYELKAQDVYSGYFRAIRAF